MRRYVKSCLTQVTYDGSRIFCQLERKPVKNLNLRTRKDGNVFESANDLVSVNKADEFVIIKVAYTFPCNAGALRVALLFT